MAVTRTSYARVPASLVRLPSTAPTTALGGRGLVLIYSYIPTPCSRRWLQDRCVCTSVYVNNTSNQLIYELNKHLTNRLICVPLSLASDRRGEGDWPIAPSHSEVLGGGGSARPMRSHPAYSCASLRDLLQLKWLPFKFKICSSLHKEIILHTHLKYNLMVQYNFMIYI